MENEQPICNHSLPWYVLSDQHNPHLQSLQECIKLPHIAQSTLCLPKSQVLSGNARQCNTGVHAQAAAAEGSGGKFPLKVTVTKLRPGLHVEGSRPVCVWSNFGDVVTCICGTSMVYCLLPLKQTNKDEQHNNTQQHEEKQHTRR